jgi:DNA-directed RNA polymerase subunit M/transcription elongation factor TFIIS
MEKTMTCEKCGGMMKEEGNMMKCEGCGHTMPMEGSEEGGADTAATM